ncbi:cobalt ABC transporter [Aestuariimicrobium soli]|uniref:cobalt ABC transporter n=1 Tax=Aestuariimicrobium soli TaxID=2035834 RepID=UPI003EC0140B
MSTWVRIRSNGGRTVLLIDGGSGAGKTGLATRLADELGADLVSLDSVYPGWQGLARAQQWVPGIIAGEGHPRWDWERDRPVPPDDGGWVDVPADRDLVIEGCGALTPASSRLATATIWCELDAATRKRRALARDGDAFAPWWDTWAEQEHEHWRAHRPWSLAQLVLPMGGADQPLQWKA